MQIPQAIQPFGTAFWTLRMSANRSTRRFSWAPGLVLALAGAVTLVGLSSASTTRTRDVALVFAPWASTEEALSVLPSLNARLLGAGSFENVLIVRFDQPADADLLRSHGVWLTLDPKLVPVCGSLAASPAMDPVVT